MSEIGEQNEKQFFFDNRWYQSRSAYEQIYRCMYCALQERCDELAGFKARREFGVDGYGQGVDFPSCMPGNRADGCAVFFRVDLERTREYQREASETVRLQRLELQVEELRQTTARLVEDYEKLLYYFKNHSHNG